MKKLILITFNLLFIISAKVSAQDLMARQAPINAKLRAVDSVAIRHLQQTETFENPAGDLYPDWSNEFVGYNQMPPAEYRIDLRDFHMPCDSRVINSHYGYRRQFGRQHYGTDIKVYIGDTIRAAFSGKVRIAKDQGYRKGYGKYVVIRHPNGLETVYGHMSKHLVQEGQVLRAGDPIGLGGNTGRSTGPHLHFETRLLGEKINPENLFSFEAGDIRGDYYVYRRGGHSQLMAAHDLSNLPPVETEVAEAKAAESKAFQQQKMDRSKRSVIYKVRSGDTLSKIAKKYGVTIDRLCRLNNISRNKVLRPGQILKCS